MRAPLAILLSLLPLTVYPQGFSRNFFTTNFNPRVTVVAGSNATVQASLVGVDQRIFTVNAIPGAGTGQTNNTIVIGGTNVVVITNSSGGVTTYTVHGLSDTNVLNAWGSTNFLPLAGGTLTGPVYTTDSSTMTGPASNQIPSAHWVRSLLSSGVTVFNTTNLAPGFVYGAVPFLASSTIPVQFARVYSAVTNNQYVGAVAVATNLTQIGGPFTIGAYLSFNSGGGRAVSIKPEIYYSYDNGTNLLGDWDCAAQAITGGVTNRYDFVVSFPTTVSTGGTFTVYRVFKVASQNANPNLVVCGGTNTPGQISYQTPAIQGGSFVGTFTGNGAGLTNLSQGAYTGTLTNSIDSAGTVVSTNSAGTNALLGAVYLGANYTNMAIYANTNVLQFRNTRANGTNIFNVDPDTGALLWNTDNKYDIGASGANRPKSIYSAGSINSASTIIASSTITAGGTAGLSFSARTTIFAPNSWGIRICDAATESRDRFYINGQVKGLTSSSAISLFTVTSRTNAFVGGTVDFTIFCTDNTEAQTYSGHVVYSCINTNGVWFAKNAFETGYTNAITSGTLTTAWGIIDDPTIGKGSTNVNVQVTATTSLTPAASKFYILWQLRNNATNSITAL